MPYIDVSKYSIEQGNIKFKKYIENGNVVLSIGDITEIKLPDSDLILCRDTIQHIFKRKF